MDEPMSREIRAYLERADEALTAARDNLALPHVRVAASQAYYAMFYAAHALLAAKGLATSKHSGVISLFGEHFARPKLLDPELHRWLREGLDRRVTADYQTMVDVDPETAQEQIARAEQFVAEARKWLEENAR